MTTLHDVLRTDLRTITSTETLLDAARAFAGEVLGLLVVVEQEQVVGVLSERDVVRSLGEGEEPGDTHVFDAMTEDVVTVDVGATVADAVRVMLDDEIRHLVVTEHGRPAGVVSARDLLRAQLAPA